jgi:hypothetical protein
MKEQIREIKITGLPDIRDGRKYKGDYMIILEEVGKWADIMKIRKEIEENERTNQGTKD